ncbi:MAG: HAMP domain-containing histidine kinase [Cytophagales bacterium]|nr:HAMP domain-containing histidine kinase [Cytophagales bacterium]
MKLASYSKQQIGKIGLIVVAILIFFLSTLYTNQVVKRIAKEEEEKVRLWATAIQEKAKLVKYTQELFARLENEERKKGELWAEGMRQLITAESGQNINFVFEVVKGNETLPVILTDENGTVISSRNLDETITKDEDYFKKEIEEMKNLHLPIEINILGKTKNYLYYRDSHLFVELRENLNGLISSFISEVVINSASLPVIYTDSTQENVLAFGNLGKEDLLVNDSSYFKTRILEMRVENTPLIVDFGNGEVNYIFYQESLLRKQLRFYPYIQFAIIGVFILVAYSFFNSNRKAEQNQVWVGMSKETAHQLGTPISSLLAWVELLEAQYEDEMAVGEMKKDIDRLQTIADRFSKIGSKPILEEYVLSEVLENALTYLKKRVSKHVSFELNGDLSAKVLLNLSLFEWVVENLTKNAVDAMEGRGKITYIISREGDKIVLDVKDTGKGIARGKQKKVFDPGFTTKKRGWGLGLTLVKRIVEIYHKGSIFVKESEQDKGTTFRILLKEREK